MGEGLAEPSQLSWFRVVARISGRAGRETLQLKAQLLSLRALFVAVGAIHLATAALLLVVAVMSDGDASRLRGVNGGLPQFAGILAAFLLGGALLPQYSILVAHGMDRTVPVYVPSGAVTLLLVFTVGAVVGPLAAAAFAAVLGDGAAVWMEFVIVAAYLLFTLHRLRRRVPSAARGARRSPGRCADQRGDGAGIETLVPRRAGGPHPGDCTAGAIARYMGRTNGDRKECPPVSTDRPRLRCHREPPGQRNGFLNSLLPAAAKWTR